MYNISEHIETLELVMGLVRRLFAANEPKPDIDEEFRLQAVLRNYVRDLRIENQFKFFTAHGDCFKVFIGVDAIRIEHLKHIEDAVAVYTINLPEIKVVE